MDRPVLAVQQDLQTAKLDSSVSQGHGPSLGDLVFKITDPRQTVLDAPPRSGCANLRHASSAKRPQRDHAEKVDCRSVLKNGKGEAVTIVETGRRGCHLVARNEKGLAGPS